MRMSSPDTTWQMQSLLPAPAPAARSMFGSHHLRPAMNTPVLHRNEQPDWVFGILITCFVLLAWLMVSYRKRLFQLISAAFSRRFLSQLGREGNLLRERIALALGAIYILTFSLVVYEWTDLHLDPRATLIDGSQRRASALRIQFTQESGAMRTKRLRRRSGILAMTSIGVHLGF